MIMDADLRRQREEVWRLTVDGRKHADENKSEQAVGCYLQAYHTARKINASTEQGLEGNDTMEEVCAFNLAAAYIMSNKPREGLNYLKKAGTPDSNNGDFFFNMAYAYEQLQEPVEALENYEKAANAFEKFDMKLQSLEKCLPFYQKRKLFVNRENERHSTAGVYKRMVEIHRLQNDFLKEATCRYEMASQLHKGNDDKAAMDEINECWNIMDRCTAVGRTCIIAAKILNDAGLFYTKLKHHAEAERCFEKALEMIHQSPDENFQMEAVIQQNLGATYNFHMDWHRAIKFHEDAIVNYGKIKYRNGEGQCFTNLAYALSQLNDFKEAEVAFRQALQAAKHTNDNHMRWQVYEGLGDVNVRMGHPESVNYYKKALLCVGETDAVAGDRIMAKMMDAGWYIRNPGQQLVQMLPATPNFAAISTSNSGQDVVQPHQALIQPHHAVILQSQQAVLQSQQALIQPHQDVIRPQQARAVSATPSRPTLAETAEPKPRRHIRMRKSDSIGPHLPKMARGLSDSLVPAEIKEEESESETDSSSGSESGSEESSSETDSSEDNKPQPPPQRLILAAAQPLDEGSQAKVDAIFRPPGADSPDASPRVTEYERMLQEKEARENARNAAPVTQTEESSSEDGDDESGSSESESEDESESDSDTEVKRAVPPLPTHSPPPTGSAQGLGTYMHPKQHPESSHNAPYNDQQQNLSHRPVTASKPAPGRWSPTPVSSANQQKTHARSADSPSEEDPPYASIDTTTKRERTMQEEGNSLEDRPKSKIITKRQKSRENYFDSEESDSEMGGDKKQHKDTSDKEEDDENPYTSIKFEREAKDSDEEEETDGKPNLSRGERDKMLYEEHMKLRQKQAEKEQEEEAKSAKNSKSCIIM